MSKSDHILLLREYMNFGEYYSTYNREMNGLPNNLFLLRLEIPIFTDHTLI